MQKETKTYQNLPNNPGVYLFKDKSGHVLYVGKALSLKKRVRNYFDKTPKEERIKKLLTEFKKIDFLATTSEIEALLLEARLIKQHWPKYNVRLKDDKRYLYVGITKESYPQIKLIRQPERELSLLAWYGPFPTSASLKEILRLLRRVFPYRSCRKLTDKLCLYYHLNLCPGMCLEETKDYPKTIKKIMMFLDGQINPLVKNLQKEMKEASDKQKYELAGQLKRQIQLMENLLRSYSRGQEEDKPLKQMAELRKLLVQHSGIEPNRIERLEAYDVANLGENLIVGSMVVLTEGEPDKSQYRQFRLQWSGGDPGGIKQILSRRLAHQEWLFPQVILVDGGKTQISAAFEALKEKNLAKQIPVLGLAKKEEKIIIPKIIKEEIVAWKTFKYQSSSLPHQGLQQARDEAHRFAQRYYKKLHQKATFSFGLKRK
ncbi:MAG: GIY-YIG nuclease family protein [Candidatus Shapirobacteria bacterium]|nr:GIY-YIG nuclease family protein [Candidatus Shapirobacteria bacterium]